MKPNLIVLEDQRDASWRERWDALTWEQRRRMTAAELIEAMGPLHVNHEHHELHTRIPRPAIPLPNLVEVGRGPQYDIPAIHSFWGLITAAVKLVLR